MQETKNIPFFNYREAFSADLPAYVDILQDVVKRGAFIQQQDLVDFEARMEDYLGVKHVIGVGNATDGLIMAWRAAGLKAGDEVLFPSHTMVATGAAIHFAGGTPVPVDCGPDHLMDPDDLEHRITDKTVAISPVQLNGRTCDMDRIQAVADKYGLYILEDSAQALGSKFKGKFASTFGRAAAFSFYPAKILGCFGDGGAVVTNEDEIAEKVLLLRDHGRAESGDVVMWGLNSRLDNFQAAVLDFQFKDYQKIIDRRRAIASMYQERLGDLQEVQLPPAPDSDPDHYDVYQNYEIEADRRDELQKYLKQNGIGTLIQWSGTPVHQFEKLGLRGECPATDRLFERCIMIPMNMTVTDEEVDYIANKIRAFYAK